MVGRRTRRAPPRTRRDLFTAAPPSSGGAAACHGQRRPTDSDSFQNAVSALAVVSGASTLGE
ncbi:hypothetical protein HNR06_001381 [Nocardiopsis arvandica]|uniref:Uncharacterized protein n=1 Tax=Nocardiopsis sinuspersici TaxID=501010 RepID=A0A7Y9XB83_9ACTN|nr:hypothetical protein [Nocardiopsis sinuspersici]